MRLIGDDLLLVSLKKAGVYQGDGIRTLNALTGIATSSIYQIVQKGLDRSIFTPESVGDFYYSRFQAEVLAVDDKVELFTEEVMADAKNLNLNITAEEIKITSIDDSLAKYTKGVSEATGSITFQVQTEAIKPQSLYNTFFKVVSVDERGVSTYSDTLQKDVFIKGVLQREDKDTHEQVFLLAQIELFGITLGADMGTAQEYTSGVKLKGIDPILYVVEALNG